MKMCFTSPFVEGTLILWQDKLERVGKKPGQGDLDNYQSQDIGPTAVIIKTFSVCLYIGKIMEECSNFWPFKTVGLSHT